MPNFIISVDYYNADGTFNSAKQFTEGEYIDLLNPNGGQIRAVAIPTNAKMTRVEAYEIARTKVAELYAVKNDRGYPRFSGNVGNVIDEELKIALFLLNE